MFRSDLGVRPSSAYAIQDKCINRGVRGGLVIIQIFCGSRELGEKEGRKNNAKRSS